MARRSGPFLARRSPAHLVPPRGHARGSRPPTACRRTDPPDAHIIESSSASVALQHPHHHGTVPSCSEVRDHGVEEQHPDASSTMRRCKVDRTELAIHTIPPVRSGPPDAKLTSIPSRSSATQQGRWALLSNHYMGLTTSSPRRNGEGPCAGTSRPSTPGAPPVGCQPARARMATQADEGRVRDGRTLPAGCGRCCTRTSPRHPAPDPPTEPENPGNPGYPDIPGCCARMEGDHPP